MSKKLINRVIFLINRKIKNYLEKSGCNLKMLRKSSKKNLKCLERFLEKIHEKLETVPKILKKIFENFNEKIVQKKFKSKEMFRKNPEEA